MYTLKFLYRKIVGMLQQVWLFPRVVMNVLKRRRRQFALNALEAERLDRIRNPSRYLGK